VYKRQRPGGCPPGWAKATLPPSMLTASPNAEMSSTTGNHARRLCMAAALAMARSRSIW